MLHKIFNLRNILSTISFLTLICAPATVEAEMYATATVLIVIMGITAYLALREDGKKIGSATDQSHRTYK